MITENNSSDKKHEETQEILMGSVSIDIYWYCPNLLCSQNINLKVDLIYPTIDFI